jgi:ribonuclease P/MRP protein subunit POP7
MSAISRIRKHISRIQKRESQSVAAAASKRGGMPLQKAKGDRILAAAIESLERQDAAVAMKRNTADEVLVKGTGKAIERVLSVAGWLQDRAAEEGVRVRLETGSWWAIDDVEVLDEVTDSAEGMEVDQEQKTDQGEEGSDDVPDSRMRSVSVLTIRVAVL